MSSKNIFQKTDYRVFISSEVEDSLIYNGSDSKKAISVFANTNTIDFAIDKNLYEEEYSKGGNVGSVFKYTIGGL